MLKDGGVFKRTPIENNPQGSTFNPYQSFILPINYKNICLAWAGRTSNKSKSIEMDWNGNSLVIYCPFNMIVIVKSGLVSGLKVFYSNVWLKQNFQKRASSAHLNDCD